MRIATKLLKVINMASRFEESWESAKKNMKLFLLYGEKKLNSLGDWLEDKVFLRTDDSEEMQKRTSERAERDAELNDRRNKVLGIKSRVKEKASKAWSSVKEAFSSEHEEASLGEQIGHAADETINKAQDKLEDWQRARQKEQNDKEKTDRRARHKPIVDDIRERNEARKAAQEKENGHATHSHTARHTSEKSVTGWLSSLFSRDKVENSKTHTENHAKTEKGHKAPGDKRDKNENSKTHTAQHAKTSAKTGGQGRH
jgi:hypothetical protein